ncbi:aspartic peptidase domain-containing protein [Podospora appendiculata]|uniref:Aspartic peptidase domain-containing protein n=1 Tax=Podospora appendiculata TaxID=314037 RepID=A0AAE0XK47_9PEZI|nr:aspartic peptidase domain-containing protein [Podospora appendiculata]
MKLVSLAALLTLACSASGVAAQHVQFSLNRGIPGLRLGSPSPLSRRQAYTEILANNITGGLYFIDVEVGTPGQTVTLALDTGSSDAWLVAPNADLCTSKALQGYYADSCSTTYNYEKSSSYKLVKTNGFKIQYLDGSVASGDYISDNFSIGDVTIKSLQMGYATETVRGTGILGIGFAANEATTKTYPNLIDELFNQGLIGSKAYSLYLNDRRSDAGNILLGGIDTDKYIGKLDVLPIITDSVFGEDNRTGPSAFVVGLSGMSLAYTNGSNVNITTTTIKTSYPAILDSGTTLTYLPDYMAQQIFSEFGTVTDARKRGTGLTLIDCEYLNAEPDLVMTFRFGNNTSGRSAIEVPIWEMVLDILQGYEDLLPSNLPWEHACLFGIQSTGPFETGGSVSSGNFALLGETFLRSAYVVYDLTHVQIGMAQANLNSTTSTIIELSAKDAGLPSPSGVKEQHTPSSTASSSSSSSSPTATSSLSPTGSGSSSSGTGSGTTTAPTAAVTTEAKNAALSSRPGGGGVWSVLAAAIFVGGTMVVI